ncbi:MAG: hypothetical protein AAGF90_17075 [Pseudomonadota bacterium]
MISRVASERSSSRILRPTVGGLSHSAFAAAATPPWRATQRRRRKPSRFSPAPDGTPVDVEALGVRHLDGRYANGLNYADIAAGVIGRPQSRTPAPGGGADFARGDLSALEPIALRAQVDLLEADLTASPSDIREALLRNVGASFFLRLSDLNGILLAATTPAGVDEAVAAAGAAAAVNEIVDQARPLVEISVDEIVVQTLPPLSFFPGSAPPAALLADSHALDALSAPCGHRRIAQKQRSRSPWRPFARPAALLGRQRQGRRMNPPSAECSPTRDSLEHRQLR